MKIFIPFLLATLPCLGFAITWENQCAGNGFSLIDESDHFEVCKKPKTDDGITNTVSIPAADAQGVLQSLEKVFSFYTDSLGWMLPFPGGQGCSACRQVL